MKLRLQKIIVDGILLPSVGILICIGLWWLLSALTWDAEAGASTFPSPATTWRESSKYILAPFSVNEEEGYRGIGLQVLSSLGLVAKGYFLALVLAVPVGFLLGASPKFTKCFDPIFQILRPVSPLAWFPLAMLVVMPLKRQFPSVQPIELQCIFTIAICAVWPTILNTAVGVRAIPQDYLNVARVLRLNPWQRFMKVLLPATLPYMFTGFRLSLGIAWLVIVAAEMLAGKAGIGYFLWDSYNAGSYGAMIASIIVIGLVGFVLDRLMTVVEKNVNVILNFPSLARSLIELLLSRRAAALSADTAAAPKEAPNAAP